jgi:hypothetical protein
MEFLLFDRLYSLSYKDLRVEDLLHQTTLFLKESVPSWRELLARAVYGQCPFLSTHSIPSPPFNNSPFSIIQRPFFIQKQLAIFQPLRYIEVVFM